MTPNEGATQHPRAPRPILSVVLLEDHLMVATAIEAVLHDERDIEVRGVAASAAEGTNLARSVQPDVIVSDHQLADGEVTDRIADLVAVAPATRVLVMAGLPTEQAFVHAMDAGAAGFVSKAQSMPELLDAVRRVAAGETVVSPGLLPSLVRRIGGTVDRQALTCRELDILQRLAAGGSTSQIASALALSPNTVRNHVSHLSRKLGAHSRLEAVSIGVRRGLIAAG